MSNTTTPNNAQNKTPTQYKKYPIQLFEWNKYYQITKKKARYWVGEGKINCKTFNMEIPLEKKIRLSDVKEFIKEETIKSYEPICTCFLRIYKDTKQPKNVNQEYNDDIFLENTIFNEKNTIYVGIPQKNALAENGKKIKDLPLN